MSKPDDSATDDAYQVWGQVSTFASPVDAQGKDVALWNTALRQQIYEADNDYIARMQALLAPAKRASLGVINETRLAFKKYAILSPLICRLQQSFSFTKKFIYHDQKIYSGQHPGFVLRHGCCRLVAAHSGC